MAAQSLLHLTDFHTADVSAPSLHGEALGEDDGHRGAGRSDRATVATGKDPLGANIFTLVD